MFCDLVYSVDCKCINLFFVYLQHRLVILTKATIKQFFTMMPTLKLDNKLVHRITSIIIQEVSNPDLRFRLFPIGDLRICNTKITPFLFVSVHNFLYFEFLVDLMKYCRVIIPNYLKNNMF